MRSISGKGINKQQMKDSGWSSWSHRYGKYRRGRDLSVKDRRAGDLGQFAVKSRGPVQAELWESELVGYTDSGAVAVDPERVKRQADQLQRESKDRSYDKDYLVRSELEDAWNRGESITKQTAERRYNQKQAVRARAVLFAAKAGKVDLTRAQRERLQDIERGRYLDLVYSGSDKGTLYQPKKRGGRGNEADQARADELRAYTYENRNRATGRVARYENVSKVSKPDYQDWQNWRTSPAPVRASPVGYPGYDDRRSNQKPVARSGAPEYKVSTRQKAQSDDWFDDILANF